MNGLWREIDAYVHAGTEAQALYSAFPAKRWENPSNTDFAHFVSEILGSYSRAWLLNAQIKNIDFSLWETEQTAEPRLRQLV